MCTERRVETASERSRYSIKAVELSLPLTISLCLSLSRSPPLFRSLSHYGGMISRIDCSFNATRALLGTPCPSITRPESTPQTRYIISHYNGKRDRGRSGDTFLTASAYPTPASLLFIPAHPRILGHRFAHITRCIPQARAFHTITSSFDRQETNYHHPCPRPPPSPRPPLHVCFARAPVPCALLGRLCSTLPSTKI